MFGEPGEYVSDIGVQVFPDSLVPLWNGRNAPSQGTFPAIISNKLLS